MNRLRWIVIALLLLPALGSTKETVQECKRKCPPKSQECIDCCQAQDKQVNGAIRQKCSDKCTASLRRNTSYCTKNYELCGRKAIEECEKIADAAGQEACFARENQRCRDTAITCQRRYFSTYQTCEKKCSEDELPIDGGCSGEKK